MAAAQDTPSAGWDFVGKVLFSFDDGCWRPALWPGGDFVLCPDGGDFLIKPDQGDGMLGLCSEIVGPRLL